MKATHRLVRHVPGVMNKTELQYEKLLSDRKAQGDIIDYWFECFTLKLGDQCRYTPDFAVITADLTLEFHEVKGARAIFKDDSKAKIRAAANKFPFPFFVAFATKQGFEIEDFTRKVTE